MTDGRKIIDGLSDAIEHAKGMTEHSADTVERMARRLYEADYPAAVQTGSWTDQSQLKVSRYENLARAALSALTVEDAAKVLLAKTEAAKDADIGPWLRAIADTPKEGDQ